MAEKNPVNGLVPVTLFHSAGRGRIYLGDSLSLFRGQVQSESVDLIMTTYPDEASRP